MARFRKVIVTLYLLCGGTMIVAQQPQGRPRLREGLSLPVILRTTVKAVNARYGDAVEFKMLEAVFLQPGLVIPETALLSGRVLGASPLRNSEPSWIVIVVDRVEWKDHQIQLRSFIVQQLGKTRAQALDVLTLNGEFIIVPDAGRAPQGQNSIHTQLFGVDDVKLFFDNKGENVFLISAKRNLVLSSGTEYLLKEFPEPQH
jgi:hypothetical protein